MAVWGNNVAGDGTSRNGAGTIGSSSNGVGGFFLQETLAQGRVPIPVGGIGYAGKQ